MLLRRLRRRSISRLMPRTTIGIVTSIWDATSAAKPGIVCKRASSSSVGMRVRRGQQRRFTRWDLLTTPPREAVQETCRTPCAECDHRYRLAVGHRRACRKSCDAIRRCGGRLPTWRRGAAQFSCEEEYCAAHAKVCDSAAESLGVGVTDFRLRARYVGGR